MYVAACALVATIWAMVAPTQKIDDGLVDVRVATKTTIYLRELWDRRSYTWYVAESEVRKRQISTFFGSFWHLLNPALSIAVYFLIFGVILKTDRGVEGSFLLFLTVGLFVFQFTQRAVTQGALSIIANRGLVQAIRFPRTLLPLSATLTEAIAAAPSFVVIYVVAFIEGQSPRWTWPLFPLIAIWQVVFNLGLAMIAARITTRFRDMVQLLPFMFRLLMYGSGVLFAVESYVSGPALFAIQVLNPIFGFISLSRWAVMGSEVATSTLIALIIWTLASLLGGFAFFKAAEHRYDHA